MGRRKTPFKAGDLILAIYAKCKYYMSDSQFDIENCAATPFKYIVMCLVEMQKRCIF